MKCLWLTRPEADSVSMAAELAAHGIETCIAPVMRIAPLKLDPVPHAPDALLVTSRHAVHALQPSWQHLPVFCVGEATAEAVREMGFHHVHLGDGDALSLLRAITYTLPQDTQLLYLSGAEIQLDPAPLLAAKQITCTRAIVYDAVAEATLPSFLRMRLAAGEIDAVALFSARSAQLTCRLLQEEGLAAQAAGLDAYCLSLAVAQAAAALPWRSMHVAHMPTRETFVAMLAGRIAS